MHASAIMAAAAAATAQDASGAGLAANLLSPPRKNDPLDNHRQLVFLLQIEAGHPANVSG
jgi:hypothetical protein